MKSFFRTLCCAAIILTITLYHHLSKKMGKKYANGCFMKLILQQKIKDIMKKLFSLPVIAQNSLTFFPLLHRRQCWNWPSAV